MTEIFKKILVPTDNSENAREAFKYAADLAEKYDSTINVVHVIDTSHFDQVTKYASELYMQSPQRYEETVIKEKTKETKDFIKKNLQNDKGLKVEKIIRRGKPFVEIIKTAKEIEADLIVMGTHGKTGLANVLMGSVAEKVVRKAPCPVLRIKPWGFKFSAP